MALSKQRMATKFIFRTNICVLGMPATQLLLFEADNNSPYHIIWNFVGYIIFVEKTSPVGAQNRF
jgi:hypothetical protein